MTLEVRDTGFTASCVDPLGEELPEKRKIRNSIAEKYWIRSLLHVELPMTRLHFSSSDGAKSLIFHLVRPDQQRFVGASQPVGSPSVFRIQFGLTLCWFFFYTNDLEPSRTRPISSFWITLPPSLRGKVKLTSWKRVSGTL